MTAEPPRDSSREPIFNVPAAVGALMAALVLLHGLRLLLARAAQEQAFYMFALYPERFWALPGDPMAYPNLASRMAPLLGHGLLHADWMHVGVNATFGLAFGAPVARVLGPARFFAIYLASQIVGGVAFLALNPPGGQTTLAIGASGAISGLTGAAFLLMRGGRLTSQPFLLMSALFIGGNAVLALVGPGLLGASIAWEAHVGGYVAGALATRFILR